MSLIIISRADLFQMPPCAVHPDFVVRSSPAVSPDVTILMTPKGIAISEYEQQAAKEVNSTPCRIKTFKLQNAGDMQHLALLKPTKDVRLRSKKNNSIQIISDCGTEEERWPAKVLLSYAWTRSGDIVISMF